MPKDRSKYGKGKVFHYEEEERQCNSRCQICDEKETSRNNSGGIKPLAWDHCHETGQWRGVLCAKCNAGLGCFEDNIELLKNAIEYLQRWRSQDVRV